MDPAQIIQEIGGGLAAVCIVVQACAIVALYRRNNQLQDKLLDMTQAMGKENSDLVTDNNTALGANAEIMRQVVRVLERFK
ncbi:hypothetical protein [Paracoccus fontiphilus]|uniref:Uncharacterized protein n=1 Tax=Paracoccus fontiphilus TaxID=1815556 RepID=A0ABV7IGS2_9RHOB|nr:hypothetical protein [Paracoccus fontiphilus]